MFYFIRSISNPTYVQNDRKFLLYILRSVKAVKGKSTENSPITIDDDDDEDDDDEGDQTMKSVSSLKKSASADSMGDSDSLPDLDAEPPTIAPEKPSVKERKSGMNNIVQDVRLKCKFYFDKAYEYGF